MNSIKFFPVLVIALITTMLSSCNDIKEATVVSVTTNINLNIEADVLKTKSTVNTEENETNNFYGSTIINIDDYPELKKYNTISATVSNAKVSTSYNEEGNYFAYVTITSTSASESVKLDENVIGKTIENNSSVNSLAQSIVIELIEGKYITVSVSGTTNIPDGEKLVYNIAIEAKLRTKTL